jgi:hypothetical protein
LINEPWSRAWAVTTIAKTTIASATARPRGRGPFTTMQFDPTWRQIADRICQ